MSQETRSGHDDDPRAEFYAAPQWAGMKSGFAGESFSYKNYFASSDILAALQLMPDEIRWLTTVPAHPEQCDVVLFLGCNALKTPHLILSVTDILGAMGLDFATIGGPANCCGIVHHLGEKFDVADAVADAATAKVARFQPGNVVSICPNCNYHYDNVVSQTDELPFQMEQIYEFLHARLANLTSVQPVAKRVGLHRHAGTSHHQDRHGDMCADILRAIPGIELVELPVFEELGAYCAAKSMTLATAERYEEIMDELFSFAARECDVMATMYHSCQRELCGRFHRAPDLDVKNVCTILAEAMGFHHEDRFARYRRIGDIDRIMEDAAPYIAAHGLNSDAVRKALAAVI